MSMGCNPPGLSDTQRSLESDCEKSHMKMHVFGRLYLIASYAIPREFVKSYKLFSIDGVVSYIGFCDDFGPMNLGSIYQFCTIVDKEFQRWPNEDIALYTSPHCRTFTNTVFLIGSYLMMIRGWDPEKVANLFHSVKKSLVSYRDVSPGEQNFSLYLKDCWEGLHQAKVLGWVNFDIGGFDPVCYQFFLHIIYEIN